MDEVKHIANILLAKNGYITGKKVISFIGEATELVEKLCKNKDGKTKQAIVISVLEYLAEQSELEKQEIKFLIEHAAPTTIDLIIKASKGLMELNKQIINCCC